jgi:hypothetical protein
LIVKSAIFEVNLFLLISLLKTFLSQKDGAGLAFGGPGSDFIGAQTAVAACDADRRGAASIA